jgi:hypothetical protein
VGSQCGSKWRGMTVLLYASAGKSGESGFQLPGWFGRVVPDP